MMMRKLYDFDQPVGGRNVHEAARALYNLVFGNSRVTATIRLDRERKLVMGEAGVFVAEPSENIISTVSDVRRMLEYALAEAATEAVPATVPAPEGVDRYRRA